MGILASPLTIISRTEEATDIQNIVDIVLQNKVESIIIGLPFNMDGSLGKQAEKVQAFAAALAEQTEIPIQFRDERLSTVEAKDLVRSVRKTNRKTRYDAAAAALILQSHLDEAAEK